MTHLILHKVRGQPAFDVAEQMSNGWWIIPTSGHRAYPYWDIRLDALYLGGEVAMTFNLASMPPNHPDHYSINDTQPTPTPKSTPTLDDLD